MSTPADKKLYDQVKKEIYEQYPKHSAYRSGLLVQEYKKRGGTYKGKENKSAGLNRWFNDNGLTNVVKLVIRINRMCIDLLLELTKTPLQHLKN